MNRRSLVVACWLCPVLWGLLTMLGRNTDSARAADSPAFEEGFTSIFNGRDLDGWEGDRTLWKVESGMLVGDSQGIPKNQFLATTRRYGDFELRLQFRLRDGVGNSGIQFRSERDPAEGSTEVSGYQADIGENYWGCLYDEHRRNKILMQAPKSLREKLKPAAWNDYTIRAEGDRVTLAINGVTTVDYREADAAIPRTGIIAVQVHSGPPLRIEFRNLRIREL